MIFSVPLSPNTITLELVAAIAVAVSSTRLKVSALRRAAGEFHRRDSDRSPVTASLHASPERQRRLRHVIFHILHFINVNRLMA